MKLEGYLLLLFTLIYSSCAYQTGLMTGNASITDANFQIIGLAKGTAKSSRTLGIGTSTHNSQNLTLSYTSIFSIL